MNLILKFFHTHKLRNDKIVTSCNGFTILEVVVAVLILSVAYVSILQNFSLSLKNIRKVETKREELLTQALIFDQYLRDAVLEESDIELDGEVYFEGVKGYNLLKVTDESGELMTFLIERL